MKTNFSLLIPFFFLSFLLFSCQQWEEELNEIEDPWENYPYEEVHISKTENFVKQFAELTGSKLQTAHIADYLIAHPEEKLKNAIEETNTKMKDNGFDNFDLSNVYFNEENRVLFYPLFRTDDAKNIDHCMPFFLTVNSESEPSLSEGPVTVAMALAAEADSQIYNKNKVASHFLPISTLNNGFGNFEKGVGNHRYNSPGGTVEITYESLKRSGLKGVLKVEALSSDGTYSFKKMWKITYD